DELLGLPREVLTGSPPRPGATRYVIEPGVGLPSGRRRLECLSRALPATMEPLVEMACVFDMAQLDARRVPRPAPVAALDATRLDAETGLLNRKTVLQELTSQVSRTRRYGNPLSVVVIRLIGVDPETAPSLRRSVAQTLKGSLRWVDLI